MSKMISGYDYMQSDEIIAVPKKQVIVPRFKNLLKGGKFTNKTSLQVANEQIFMLRFFKKLTAHQMDHIQKTNNKIMQKKFDSLKRKMRKSAESNSNQNTVSDFFQAKNHRNGRQSINDFRSNKCQSIDIAKKFGAKIANKLYVLQQSSSIENQKNKYRNWLNSCHNSPRKSPNFLKMNYAIEKANKKQNVKQMLKNPDQTQNMFRGSYQERTFIKRQNSSYVPRSNATYFERISKVL